MKKITVSKDKTVPSKKVDTSKKPKTKTVPSKKVDTSKKPKTKTVLSKKVDTNRQPNTKKTNKKPKTKTVTFEKIDTNKKSTAKTGKTTTGSGIFGTKFDTQKCLKRVFDTSDFNVKRITMQLLLQKHRQFFYEVPIAYQWKYGFEKMEINRRLQNRVAMSLKYMSKCVVRLARKFVPHQMLQPIDLPPPIPVVLNTKGLVHLGIRELSSLNLDFNNVRYNNYLEAIKSDYARIPAYIPRLQSKDLPDMSSIPIRDEGWFPHESWTAPDYVDIRFDEDNSDEIDFEIPAYYPGEEWEEDQDWEENPLFDEKVSK